MIKLIFIVLSKVFLCKSWSCVFNASALQPYVSKPYFSQEIRMQDDLLSLSKEREKKSGSENNTLFSIVIYLMLVLVGSQYLHLTVSAVIYARNIELYLYFCFLVFFHLNKCKFS